MAPLTPHRLDLAVFRRPLLALVCHLTIAGGLLPAARAQFTDFMTMDLEDLSSVRITTLGRTENAVIDYPAAATVLTAEDITRLGVTTLPEALRGIPGMQVGRIDQFNYAISVRGFNDNTVNKLLVVSDGRSLHNGTFTGTDWGLQDLLLGDLDRIEVLRGPGASLWGANAMNGFINLVSKEAYDTLGTHVAFAAGDPRLGIGEVRHGWAASPQTAARVYTKFQHQEAAPTTTPLVGITDWDTFLLGFRLDHQVAPDRQLTTIAEWRTLSTTGYNSEPILTPPYRRIFTEQRDGQIGNLSVHWQQPLAFLDGEFEVFASLDHLEDDRDTLEETRTTSTIDLQAKLNPAADHQVLAGLTFRHTQDQLSSTGIFTFSDPEAEITFFGGFIQDEWKLVPDRLRLTAGAKLERNTYSGWEFQPSVRTIWSPHPEHRLWAGYSVAARTPSRAETSIDYYGFAVAASPPEIPLPVAVNLLGSRDFTSEHLTSIELGYRYVPTPRLQFEVSAFYNDYDDIRGFVTDQVETDLSPPIPHLIASVLTTNTIAGHTRGGEVSLHWQATPELTIESSYSRTATDLHDNMNTRDDLAQFSVDLYHQSTPTETIRGQLSWNPAAAFECDLGLQHTTSLANGTVPPYTALHARLAWRPTAAWCLELIGRDLAKRIHREYPAPFARDATPNLDRAVYLRVTFQR